METEQPSRNSQTESGCGSDEVAYLLLEDCTVRVVGDFANHLPKASWLGVTRTTNNTAKIEYKHEKNQDEQLLVHVDPNGALHVSDKLSFDGTITARGHQSDAALMVGLAFTCESIAHIRIESFKLLFRNTVEIRKDQNTSASIVITFSVLSILDAQEQCMSMRVVSKALPPSVQLLYTLLRSDWDQLEQEMELLKDPIPLKDKHGYHIRNDGTSILTQTKMPLFPSKLSLQELYIRIRGSSHRSSLLRKPPPPDCDMTALPEDILVTHVAPYLLAKSLDSLRCSCAYLHKSLNAVVPGLKLQLFQHQIRSLECMRRREGHELKEGPSLEGSSFNLAYGGDMHRALTGGATVCMQSRRNREHRYRVDQLDGKVQRCTTTTDNVLSRKAARGGFLCDEPGLGKSITVLSLILQTMGIQSKTNEEEKLPSHRTLYSDEHIFRAYWREEFSPMYQRPALNKLVKQVEKSHVLSHIFYHPVDPIEMDLPDYLQIIKYPMCFKDLYARINADHYASNFSIFEADLRLCFENATLYNPVGSEANSAARELMVIVDNILQTFKYDQVRSAKRRFSNATAKPNSSVAAILEQRAKAEYLNSLLTSKSTLLVVPGNLLSHWEEQIMMHVDLSYCTNGRQPLIFRFSGNDSRTHDRIGDTLTKCTENGTHSPLIFIDKSGTRTLPNERFIALFPIVITTTQRLSNEWKNGRIERERKEEDGLVNMPYMIYSPTTQPCSLLKIHWTRLIVDEGHVMGRGKQNSAVLFASWISANRRWVMTGTPTPQTVTLSGLANMNALLHFLQHDFFGSRLSGDQVWRNAIVRGWNDGLFASFFRLHTLLSFLMMRHTKLDIDELPPPVFTKINVQLSLQETKTYNTILCAVQSNLLLTSMKGKTKGLQDSLLHRSQSKHAKRAFDNLRLACTGGTRVIPTLTQQNFDETVNLLKTHKVDPIAITLVVNYLHRAVAEGLTSCMSCGIQLNTMLVMTCGHLVCTECITREMLACPVCDLPFNVDEFQLLQPGMLYEWALNIENDKRSLTNASIPRNETQETTAVAELQVSSYDRLAVAGHVPLRPGVLPTSRRNKPNDGHSCEYDQSSTHGKCLLCLEEHDGCVLTSQDSRCQTCYRQALSCPEEESKFVYLIDKLQTLHSNYSRRTSIVSETAASIIGEKIVVKVPRRLKVIVFSQFRQSINTVGDRLLRRFGAGCVAEYWGRYRGQELMKFTKSHACFCMLLGKDGSEGLDLSFVTHIYFLEEVWDKSLESQAVARAWRMGASGHVEVETLVANDSIESMMADLEQRLTSNQENDVPVANYNDDSTLLLASAKDFLRRKQNFLLTNAKLIKPCQVDVGKKQSAKRKIIPQQAQDENEVEIPKAARVRFNIG